MKSGEGEASAAGKADTPDVKTTANTGAEPVKTDTPETRLTQSASGSMTAATANNTQDISEELPEYLYHLTSKNGYDGIMQSGEIRLSTVESPDTPYSCQGVYMIDKDNFVQNWINTGGNEELSNIDDIGKALLGYTSGGGEEIVALKIQTSNFDVSKVKFRSYLDACHEAVQDLCNEVVNPNGMYKGLSLDKISKYYQTSPIEFVYADIIPANFISGATSVPVSEEILANDLSSLLEKLFL
ncbi:MAG: hypothetical protein LUE64_01595, partial [Candidatus Gastranaerophilales bacterium]|nr:hypothetical protein [Candidatus Gastranaerophilales bacterium]